MGTHSLNTKSGGYIANQEQLPTKQIIANAVIVAQNIIKQ